MLLNNERRTLCLHHRAYYGFHEVRRQGKHDPTNNSATKSIGVIQAEIRLKKRKGLSAVIGDNAGAQNNVYHYERCVIR